MNANELRRAFVEYFTERDHRQIPSASLIPHDDTLLFTNSGMVPFKPYFVGEERPDHPRAVTIQKCVRAGGKHNDLDEVGRTKRHLTFFEMMGNFSFGDYFKERAIPDAWGFFTDVLGLDPDRLWVTVHLTDDEAEEIWANEVGVPRERIQRLDEDNWWRMADTGPNGPSSEIFWDKGPAFGPDGGPANPEADERYVEIWNLVFMQFETFEDGTSQPLPKPSIDTGAGLERILSVLQGKESVFEIDEMARLVAVASEITGHVIGTSDDGDLALRVLAEHARTMTFLISDGVLVSNEGRGYVLRRIMRRAIRFAYLLGVTDLVTPQLVDAVVEIMGPDYPQLVDDHAKIRMMVEKEEQQFRKTLARGLAILDDELAGLEAGADVPGSVAFKLHDTYGFPYEVTEEVARERGHGVDRAGFDTDMAGQRERAKANQKGGGAVVTWDELVAVAVGDVEPTPGFDRESTAIDTTIWVLDEGEAPFAVLLATPFYAESGGQIGDTGTITAHGADGSVTGVATVIDTVIGPDGVHLHRLGEIEGFVEAGQAVTARIDDERRAAIRRNHTATHLLHHALREVLGDHVTQQGSLVAPDRLRFDFSHFEQVTSDEIARIEDLVNAEVLVNPGTDHPEMTKAEAEAKGAIAFFGDKYGERVRVLTAGPSVEFCGGTHVRALGDIGLVKIVSEGSIGSNVRRVEAVTGDGAIQLLREEQATVAAAADMLKVPVGDVLAGVEKRQSEIAELKSTIASLQAQLAAGRSGELAEGAVDGIVVARVDGIGRDELRDLAIAIRDRAEIRLAVLGGAPDGGGAALVAASAGELDAGEALGDAPRMIQGGGKKNPALTMCGGKNVEGIDGALDAVRSGLGIA